MNSCLRKIAVLILVISMIVSFCGCGKEVQDIYEGFELGMTVEDAVLACKENLKCDLEISSLDLPDRVEFYEVRFGLDSMNEIFHSFDCLFVDDKLVYIGVSGSVQGSVLKEKDEMSQKDFDKLNALCADFGEYMSGYASKHGLDNVGVKEYSFEAFGEMVSYDVNYADSDKTALIWVIGEETDEDIFVRKINGALFDVHALESFLSELDVHLPYVDSYYQN